MPKLKKVQKYIKSKNSLLFSDAPDVKKRLRELFEKTGKGAVAEGGIFTLRSRGSKGRCIARIWGLSRIWQIVLRKKPCYIIEVVAERFDKLSEVEKDKVLLHEITHIPKNFSGALVPHYKKGKRKFRNLVEDLVNRYTNANQHVYSKKHF